MHASQSHSQTKVNQRTTNCTAFSSLAPWYSIDCTPSRPRSPQLTPKAAPRTKLPPSLRSGTRTSLGGARAVAHYCIHNVYTRARSGQHGDGVCTTVDQEDREARGRKTFDVYASVCFDASQCMLLSHSHSFTPNQTQSTHELHRIDKLGVPRAVGPVHKRTARHNLSRAHIHPENVWVEGKVHDAVFMVKG
jgi:hypothetical protein